MFAQTFKKLRKEKGFTQEELAARLNVVRQTVSKWEKGLSVPDATTLIEIANIFDVPVSHLLGGENIDNYTSDEVAMQLSRINEQLAIKNRRSSRIWKTILWIFITFVLINVLLFISSIVALFSFNTMIEKGEVQVEVTNEEIPFEKFDKTEIIID